MKLDKVREAIGLLNSMVECGEQHSELSRDVVKSAIQQVGEAEKDINRLINIPYRRSVFDINPYE